MSDSTQPQPPPGFPEPGGHPGLGAQPPEAGDQFPTAFGAAEPPPPFAGEVPVYDRGTPGAGRRTIVLAAVVALVVGLAGGFVAGRQTAPKGAATLAEAARLASEGKIPVGDLSSLRGNGGLGSLFRRGAGGQSGQGQGQGQGQGGQAAPGTSGQGNGNGTGGQGGAGGFLFGGGRGNRGIQATVSAVSGDVVTLDTVAGQLRVRIGPSTKIQKAAQGSKSDIAPGSRVLVSFDLGASSNDGEVSAASILAEGRS